MRQFLVLALSVPLVAWTFAQCRKPAGPLGRAYLWVMNHTHSSLTDWALKHVPLRKDDTILDIGCGGGRTVQELAALAPEGRVYGIDYSKASVAASRRTNARGIQAGRIRIELGSVASLPFADDTFDVVTAVETHYYWPDLPANMREVLRVLKPGGTIALIAEVHRRRGFDAHERLAMRLLRAAYMSPTDHQDLLTQAGFTGVSTIQGPRSGWICAIGRRPSPNADA